MSLERKIERLISRGLRLEFFLVPWDSEIFGYPVGQIDQIEITDNGGAVATFREFGNWCDANRIRLVSARLPSDCLRESMFLEEQGFRFVEMVYSPTVSLREITPKHGALVEISAVQEADLPAIQSIAGSAFSTGRFILDWRLDPEASHRRYRAWVQNSFDDPRHAVLKATVRDAIAGFFIVEELPDRSCYWHLTAVAPEWQGKGIGRELWEGMLGYHKQAGLTQIRTTISAHNAAVVNIYARLGFRFAPPQMTFHWLRS